MNIDEYLNDVMLDATCRVDLLFGLDKAMGRLTCADLEANVWWRYFCNAMGPTLNPLCFDVYLTHFAAISIKTSKGHWTQVYREGCPTGDARLLHLETDKSFSLSVALNASYFPYFPYTYDSILNAIPNDIKPMTKVIWSPDDTALSDME